MRIQKEFFKTYRYSSNKSILNAFVMGNRIYYS